MSNADKTREKLLNSMRKTKAGNEQGEQATETGNQPSPAKGESKSASRSKPARESAPKPSTAKPKTRSRQQKSDPFQSGGRVWPD
jgi:hypothetical protein